MKPAYFCSPKIGVPTLTQVIRITGVHGLKISIFNFLQNFFIIFFAKGRCAGMVDFIDNKIDGRLPYFPGTENSKLSH